jgi:hypothetical protein
VSRNPKSPNSSRFIMFPGVIRRVSILLMLDCIHQQSSHYPYADCSYNTAPPCGYTHAEVAVPPSLCRGNACRHDNSSRTLAYDFHLFYDHRCLEDTMPPAYSHLPYLCWFHQSSRGAKLTLAAESRSATVRFRNQQHRVGTSANSMRYSEVLRTIVHPQ